MHGWICVININKIFFNEAVAAAPDSRWFQRGHSVTLQCMKKGFSSTTVNIQHDSASFLCITFQFSLTRAHPRTHCLKIPTLPPRLNIVQKQQIGGNLFRSHTSFHFELTVAGYTHYQAKDRARRLWVFWMLQSTISSFLSARTTVNN